MTETPVPLAAVPSLAQLQADPGLLERLPVDALVDLRRQLRHLDADVDAAICRQTTSAAGQPAAPEPDRLLTAEEAGRLAGVKPAWLLRRAKRLPFTRKLSHKVVRFSEARLRRWLQARRP